MQIKAFESLWNFEKIHAIFKQIVYLASLTELCVVMLWVTPATRVWLAIPAITMVLLRVLKYVTRYVCEVTRYVIHVTRNLNYVTRFLS